MKSFYEDNWKKALEGAEVEPTEALWDNIAGSLDKERGKNYWVTLLMIAATISIAFSFPLTIGDSANNAKPGMTPELSQNENMLENSMYKEEVNTSSTEINKTTPGLSPISTEENTSKKSQENKGSKEEKLNLVPVEGLGITSLNLDITYSLIDVNSHYFIPYFIPIKKTEDRNLLASLHMGTGSSSTGNGMLTNSKMEAANSSDFVNDMGSIKTSTLQNETKATTFHIGTGIELPLGKRISLLAGLGYLTNKAEGHNNIVSAQGNEYKPAGIYDPIKIGSIYLSEAYHYTTTNDYINLPVSVKYPFINRKIKFRVGAGLSTDFMLSHTIYSEDYGKATFKPQEVDYMPVVLSGLFNIDISYSVSNQYALALETGIRKGITPIDKRKDFYPSSFSVGIVLFYKLR